MVIVAALVAAMAAGLIVRLLRSSIAGGRDGASAARRNPTLATGGIAVLAAVVLGLAFATPFVWSEIAIVVVALVAGAVGGLGDRRVWPPGGRSVVSVLTGVAVVAVGVRGASIGVPVADAVLTVLWVAVVMEVAHLLDGNRGVAAAVLAPVAAGLAGIAYFAGQSQVAVALGALAGGLAAIALAAPTHPRVRLGESGVAAAGALLAAAAVQIDPQRDDISGLALLLVLFGLPLACGVVVAVGRLRHGVALTATSKDGVVERFRTSKIKSGAAIIVVAVAQSAVSVLVVLADDGVIPTLVAVAAGLLVVLAVVAVLSSAKVHAERGSGRRSAGRIVLLGGAAVVVLAVVVPVIALALSVGPARAGADAIQDGLDAARDVETTEAEASFASAADSFGQAKSLLGFPLVEVGRVVPVLGRNLEGARLLVDLGSDVASAGADVAGAAPASLSVTAGSIPVDELRATAPSLQRASATLQRGVERLDDADRAYLLGPVQDGIDELDARYADEAATAARAAQAAEVTPAIFGGDGPRRYFVAMQNNAELRATGGFIGNYGELVVEDGQMRLENFARIDELNRRGVPVRMLDAPEEFFDRYERFEVASTWQSMNISPDFPTVGRLIAGAYPQSGGTEVDGVIAVDPVGLAALLELSGSVPVEGWDTEITSENVVDVTLRQAYERFDEQEGRTDFLGAVAEAVMSAATRRDLGSPPEIARVLGDAVEAGHLMAYFTREEEQAFADDIGLSWPVEPPESDAILVVNQNASANKVDYYLERSIDYDVRIEPQGESAAVSGTLGLTLENTAPDGLDPYAAGGSLEGIPAGVNRSYTSIYTPLGVLAARLDGAPTTIESEQELGRSVYSKYLDIAAGAETTLELDVAGEVELLSGGWYELRLDRQPVLNPDRVEIGIEITPGWRIAEVEGGLEVVGDRRVEATLEIDRPAAVRFRLEPTTP